MAGIKFGDRMSGQGGQLRQAYNKTIENSTDTIPPLCASLTSKLMPRSTPTDAYPTETSGLQADTEDILQAHVPLNDGVGGSGGRALDKKLHLEFLVRNLFQGFPARYTSQDASKPWLMFWTLQSFSALQVAIDPDNKQRCLSFFASLIRAEPYMLNVRWCLGRSIPLCSGNTRMGDSVVDRGRQRIYCLHTQLYALSRSLAVLVLEGGGTR